MNARVLTGLLLAAGLWAQAPPERVGRLSFVYGTVSFRPGTTQDWGDATLNLPLSDGDHLWTDLNAQAEVWAGPAAVHLAPHTGFSIVQLNSTTARLAVSEGAVNVWIARLDDGETVDLVTPTGTFRLLRPGSYRLDAVVAGNYITLSVRSGLAQATAGPLTQEIAPGQRIVLAGKPASIEMLEAVALDQWDEWCAARDEASERGIEQAEPYVPWDMPGAEDLAGNGDWETDAELGAYWTPSAVDESWVPFRNGRWIFKLPWGWTWVDAAPWGFAPSHFGRWAKVKHGWGWVPDHRHRKEPYSPATVAFGGGGGGVIRWAPLAPGESAGARRNREGSSSAEVAAFRASRPIGPVRLPESPVAYTSKTPEVEPAPEAYFGSVIRHAKPEVEARAIVAPPPTPAVQRQPQPAAPVAVVAEEPHHQDSSTHYEEPPRHQAESSSNSSSHNDEPSHHAPEPSHHSDPAPAPAPTPTPAHVESHSAVQEHHVEASHPAEASRQSSSSSSSGHRK
jgi:hypothetical protein